MTSETVEMPSRDIIGIINSPVFEKTGEFNNVLNERINDVFTLITLQNSFEKNGELNYNTIVAKSIDSINAHTHVLRRFQESLGHHLQK